MLTVCAMRKLLLADDSITIQKIVDLTFADDGFAVTVVGDGEQAIEKLPEVMPDIVLADVFMPGKSGYEVCAYIKGDERFQHIPVMLLVGSFEPYNEAEARRVGANDVLTKPFQSIRQLVSKVGALLGGDSGKQAEDQNEEQRAASASSLDTPTAETTHADEAYRSGIDKFQNDSQPDNAATPSAFSDLSLDDAMIEVTPAENFSNRHDDDAMTRDTMPLSPTDMREVASAADTAKHIEKPSREGFPGDQNSNMPETYDTGDETLLSAAPVETPPHVAEGDNNESMNEAESSKSSSQAHGAAASDDSLLDLGDLASPSAAATEADDFILDLRDQFNAVPTANASTAMETAPPSSSSADEAATLADENFAEQTETEEPSHTSFTDAPEQTFDAAAPHVENASSPVAYGEVAVPQWNSANTHTSTGVSENSAQIEPSPQSGETALNQLSPEAIDQIARRVVEHLSEKVVREIAWEVVPQLAELMIKRRLEEERSQAT